MRIGFLGTPEFACPSLRAVVKAGHAVTLVVSQPDKVRGRRQAPTPTPVRALAEQLGLDHAVLHRGKTSRDELYARVLETAPDVVVVVAFGHILREPLLRGARHGCVNVHASLLPRWRGPAPIHRAIVAGETVTGVSTMRLEEGVDTGPVYLQRETPIGADETAGEVHDRLAAMGAELLLDTLTGLEAGLSARPQPPEGITHAPLLRRTEGSMDFSLPAPACHDRVRGLFPWPSVTVLHEQERLKLVRARVASTPAAATPGTVVAIEREGVIVACGTDALELLKVQPAGKRVMTAAEYARGYRLAAGDVLRPLPGFDPVP